MGCDDMMDEVQYKKERVLHQLGIMIAKRDMLVAQGQHARAGEMSRDIINRLRAIVPRRI